MYAAELKKVFEVQRKISDIHPILKRTYPIVVVKGDELWIFEPDESQQTYKLAKTAKSKTPLPEGIRAAFPVEEYDYKMACVVSDDVFESLRGYALIFHEFVHCYQFECCELELKKSLEVFLEEQAKGNYSWELNYPFPYEKGEFQRAYAEFLSALERGDAEGVKKSRRELREHLTKKEYEYMVWQEWKEGLARFIENRILRRLGLPENHYGLEKPWDRTLFYEGGARFIEFLTGGSPTDLRGLFKSMMEF